MCGFPHVEQLSCGPVTVVRLESPASMEPQQPDGLTQWMALADQVKNGKLLVDCSSIGLMSSEMLSRLILLQRRLRQNGGALVLCSLRDEVRQMLAWTKLDRFFEIEAETEESLV